MFKMLRVFVFDFGAGAELVVLAHCMHSPPLRSTPPDFSTPTPLDAQISALLLLQQTEALKLVCEVRPSP